MVKCNSVIGFKHRLSIAYASIAGKVCTNVAHNFVTGAPVSGRWSTHMCGTQPAYSLQRRREWPRLSLGQNVGGGGGRTGRAEASQNGTLASSQLYSELHRLLDPSPGVRRASRPPFACSSFMACCYFNVICSAKAVCL